MTAVAVFDRPYIGFPSMSVAWMISVYCGTFCRCRKEKQGLKRGVIFYFIVFTILLAKRAVSRYSNSDLQSAHRMIRCVPIAVIS